MESSLQYHQMEDDEQLQVPPSVQHSTQLGIQIPDKAAPKLPTWIFVAGGRHDREVTTPPLPHHVVRDAPVEVIIFVGVHPIPVDLLESEVLWGRGVAWQVSFLPLPIMWFWLRVCPPPSHALLVSVRGGGDWLPTSTFLSPPGFACDFPPFGRP